MPAYRYGGPIYSVHGLCKALAGLGHDVHVFTTNVDGDGDSDVPLEKPDEIDGVKVWYFPSRRLRRIYWSPLMQKELKEKIKDSDIIHLHSIFLWPTWVAARIARRLKKSYIISPRGMLVKELVKRKSRFAKKIWIHFIERKNLECASAIHVTTENEKEEAQKFGFSLPEIHVIPNGVDLNDGRLDQKQITPSIANTISKKPYLLSLGRINWKKGLDRLIPALTYIPDIPLVIAGNDEENYRPKLEKLALTYGVFSRITFTGLVHGADKEALLNNASVLILPSYSENFGNVVLEAMAAGCPVVVTPEVGISDVVEKYKTGLVVDGKPEILGKSAKSLLSNNGKLKDMGERGQRTVRDHFTWSIIAKKMEEAYQQIPS
jgi:glycosyltransferase involved in cell wall biosynthesis